MDGGVILLKALNDPCNLADCLRFTASDIYISADGGFQGAEFGLRFVHHGKNFFGALAKEHSFRRQGYAMTFPDQKLLPQLLFQVVDLP